MTVLLTSTVILFLYLGLGYLPAHSVWGTELLLRLPAYSLIRGLAAIFLLLLVWHRHRELSNRTAKIFFKKNTTNLQLPEQRNNTADLIRKTTASCLLVLLLLFMHCSNAAGGIKMVSIAGNNVNMRSGPTTNSKVLWQLEKGYPLQVVTERSQWIKVHDYEGDSGWVHKALTSRIPHVVVKKKIINVRSRPSTGSPIVAKALKGTVFRTIGSVKGWLKVRHKLGVTGWVARNLVWGW